jgi:hypothetical protein
MTHSGMIATRSVRRLLGGAASLVLFVAAPLAAQDKPRLPDRLTDTEFWQLVGTISEPGGFFRMDNWTSNEMEVGALFTMLREAGRTGGVYMGVGPEQNFTYIASIKPAMAFIVDIRRQAVMQHLMYKAIFELSKDRADFIGMLFSYPRPAGVDSLTPIAQLWTAFGAALPDSAMHVRDYQRILDNLTKTHGFTLTEEEVGYIKYVYDTFHATGPTITSGGSRGGGGRGGFGGGGGGGRGGRGGGNFITLTSQSTDLAGQVQSFLVSHETFLTLKTLQGKNLLVPASGDFGGPKAIRAVGQYVRDRGATITAFYVSNVEQYLFQDNKQAAFYGNVATLPVDAGSVFIRPYALRQYTAAAALCPIDLFVKSFQAGKVFGYQDALMCPR